MRKRYYKIIDGVKIYYHGFIQKDGKRTYTWCETLILADGWIKEAEPDALEVAKRNKTGELLGFDSSKEVNAFVINGTEKWLAPLERANYLLTLDAAKESGIETIEFEGATIPVDTAIKAVKDISIYAMKCVAVTGKHKANINALTSVEAVKAYDFRVGYPEKVIINL